MSCLATLVAGHLILRRVSIVPIRFAIPIEVPLFPIRCLPELLDLVIIAFSVFTPSLRSLVFFKLFLEFLLFGFILRLLVIVPDPNAVTFVQHLIGVFDGRFYGLQCLLQISEGHKMSDIMRGSRRE